MKCPQCLYMCTLGVLPSPPPPPPPPLYWSFFKSLTFEKMTYIIYLSSHKVYLEVCSSAAIIVSMEISRNARIKRFTGDLTSDDPCWRIKVNCELQLQFLCSYSGLVPDSCNLRKSNLLLDGEVIGCNAKLSRLNI